MKNRIMIVGGGTGGTIVANLLARKLRREIAVGQVELVLISESTVHYNKPAFMYVAFNLFHHHQLARPERQLLSPEIQFITDRIEFSILSSVDCTVPVSNITTGTCWLLLPAEHLLHKKSPALPKRAIIFINTRRQDNIMDGFRPLRKWGSGPVSSSQTCWK